MSTAISDYHEKTNPYNGDLETLGFQVKTKYEEFETPLNVKTYFEQIQPLLPLKYSAFQENSDGNQGYLYPCNELLAIRLMEIISDLNIYEQQQEQLEFAIGTIVTKERNTLRLLITGNEAAAKSKLRKDQQKHKEALSPIWQQECALCKISLSTMLHASYSKPWKDSTAEERLDAFNGLLLCPNHKSLYENGYIAFDGTGKIHISSRLLENDYEKLGLHAKMRVKRLEEHKKYFKWHKKHLLK